MSEDSIKNNSEAKSEIRCAVVELENLADALELSGNPILAKKLQSIADRVHNADVMHDEAYCDMFNAWRAAVQQGTENMVSAALAGLKLTRSEEALK
jgi:hypothetical protein